MTMFSEGERVFLDTSFILDFLFGEERAVNALRNLIERDTRFYVNPIVIGEVWFQLMANEYVKRHGRYSSYGIREEVNNVKEAISVADEFFGALPNFEVVEITERTVEIAREIVDRYDLLPNDAMIVASCIQYGIRTLATFDSDFKRVDVIRTVP